MSDKPDNDSEILTELAYIYKFVRNGAWIAFVVLAVWYAYFRKVEATGWPVHIPTEIHIPTGEDMQREEDERREKQDEFERFQEEYRAKERQRQELENREEERRYEEQKKNNR